MTDSGFCVEEDVLANTECDSLIDSLSATGAGRSRAGARHLMRHPAVAAVAKHERLLYIARRILGRTAIPFRATLFAKSENANWLVVWHQDTALPLESRVEDREWGPWSTKGGVQYAHAPAWALSRIVALRIHLDPSTAENGPLRVIPGSHFRGVLSDQEVLNVARSERALDCLVPRGGVLVMRPLLIHASSKVRSSQPRRVLHIEYADSLDLRKGIRLAIA